MLIVPRTELLIVSVTLAYRSALLRTLPSEPECVFDFIRLIDSSAYPCRLVFWGYRSFDTIENVTQAINKFRDEDIAADITRLRALYDTGPNLFKEHVLTESARLFDSLDRNYCVRITLGRPDLAGVVFTTGGANTTFSD